MTNTEAFIDYAMAFEQAYLDERWSELERFFCEDATHRATGGGSHLDVDSHGRSAVVADLARGVYAVDKRFDERVPEVLVGPVERDGAVWMDWRLTLKRAGLPDLVIEGDHGTYLRDGKIERIEEQLARGIAERVDLYFQAHDAKLKPAAGPARRNSQGTPTVARMRELVETYAAAKSRADVEAALAVCSESFRLETVSFGIAGRGKAEVRVQLEAFFAAFPDYGVALEGMAFGDDVCTSWGSATMTMKGDILGVAATGRTVTLPIFCQFAFDANGIAEERFFFDLAQLARGIGVGIEKLEAALAPLRALPTAAVAA